MRIYPPNLADHPAVGLVPWVVPAAGDAAVSHVARRLRLRDRTAHASGVTTAKITTILP